ncbi:hypothetical protein [Candidatus Rickettsia kedanie]|uniref:Uncharacterized protein n=1 Tax=Candidatus Rickettsia kedanie TaxID=3115352 RepID=A0ABP9TTW4_9RICK
MPLNILLKKKSIDNEVLKDITLKFNQTISPTSSKKRLKLSSSKKKDIYDENGDYSNQTVETTTIDDSMKEYFKLMGEHTNTIYD